MKKAALIPLIFLLAAFNVSAQETCPFGLAADPAPGACARYIDENADAFCDLSEMPLATKASGSAASAPTVSEEELKQKTVAEAAALYGVDAGKYAAVLSDFLKEDVSAGDSLQTLHDQNGLCAGVAGALALDIKSNPSSAGAANIDPTELISGQELKTKKVYEVAELYGIKGEDFGNALADYLDQKVKLTDSFQVLHDNFGMEPSIAKDIAAALALENPTGPVIADAQAAKASGLPRYQLIWIALGLLALHTLTWLLVKAKKLKLLCHRRIWNTLLLLSFLSSALLGLLLIIRINWGWTIALPFNILYWHVESATAMAVITLFHLSWYWRFYTVIFKRNKELGIRN